MANAPPSETRQDHSPRRPALHSAASPPRPGQATLAVEESEVPIGGEEAAAVAFLAMPCIREHQATLLEERLRSIAGRHGGRLMVSMSEVDDISSAGVNALVAVNSYCQHLGGHLALFGLSRELHRLFKLTHLDRTMTIVSDVEEAVRSFSAGARRPWILRALSGRRKAA